MRWGSYYVVRLFVKDPSSYFNIQRTGITPVRHNTNYYTSVFLKYYLYVMCLNILPASYVCAPMCFETLEARGGHQTPGTELWMVVSYHLGARNEIWVL